MHWIDREPCRAVPVGHANALDQVGVDDVGQQERYRRRPVDDAVTAANHRYEAVGGDEHFADRGRRIRERLLAVIGPERRKLRLDDDAHFAAVGLRDLRLRSKHCDDARRERQCAERAANRRLHIHAVHVPHQPRKVGLAGVQHDVEVITHLAVREHLCVEAVHRLRDRVDVRESIRIVPVNRLAPIAARSDVIYSAREFDA